MCWYAVIIQVRLNRICLSNPQHFLKENEIVIDAYFVVGRQQMYYISVIMNSFEEECRFVFSRKFSRRGIGSTDVNFGEEQAKPIFYNNKNLMVFDTYSVPLLKWEQLHVLPCSLGQVHSGSGFTAVGQVNIAGDMDGRVAAYVAAGNAFSLFQFRVFPDSKYSLPEELIAFANPAATKEIAHLQCLHGPNNDRTGVVVRRVDGDIELWDDGQSRAPAVVYKLPACDGKICGGPPVVDTPSHSYLAAPLGKCGAVGVWHLQTGELVNLLEMPGYMLRNSSDSCSTALVMRSRWRWRGSSWPLCGPVLMAIRRRSVYFFY